MMFSGKFLFFNDLCLAVVFITQLLMIYNDIFSKSINFFGSSFIAPKPDINEKGLPQFLNSSQGMIPHFDMNQDYVYWFGVDPVNFSRIER